MSPSVPSRRAFVKRLAYATPAVLTLAAAPEFAKAGSGKWDAGGRPPPDRGRGGSRGHEEPGRGWRRGDDAPGRRRGHGPD